MHVLPVILKGLMRFSQAFECKKFQMPDFTALYDFFSS